eukprot:6471449-Heterocapsa_arctica.AAC.1
MAASMAMRSGERAAARRRTGPSDPRRSHEAIPEDHADDRHNGQAAVRDLHDEGTLASMAQSPSWRSGPFPS